jgi:hypothetical protein
MLASLVSPFLIIYFIFRKDPPDDSPITFGTLFLLAHAYLTYTTYTIEPQEFGYVGLVFAPIVEAIIVVPAAMLIIFLLKQLRHK